MKKIFSSTIAFAATAAMALSMGTAAPMMINAADTNTSYEQVHAVLEDLYSDCLVTDEFYVRFKYDYTTEEIENIIIPELKEMDTEDVISSFEFNAAAKKNPIKYPDDNSEAMWYTVALASDDKEQVFDIASKIWCSSYVSTVQMHLQDTALSFDLKADGAYAGKSVRLTFKHDYKKSAIEENILPELKEVAGADNVVDFEYINSLSTNTNESAVGYTRECYLLNLDVDKETYYNIALKLYETGYLYAVEPDADVSSVTTNDNEDGDYDGFVVSLKNSYSVLNKEWTVEDIPASGIISVKDLTHMDMSEERIKEYLERKGSVFCQILRLYVEDTSIENIKKTAAQLEKWEAASAVELVPNTANRRNMILEDGKIKEVEYVNGANTVTKTHDYIELEVGTAVDININDAHEPLYFSFDKEGVVKDSTITQIETNIGLKAINSGEVTLIATNHNKDKEYKIKIVVVDPVELAFAKAAEEVFEQIDADKIKAADSTVAAVKNGDVNSDDAVDSKDATALLIKYAEALNDDKTLRAEDMPGGDYNGDGKVDSLDATAILIAYAEWLIEQ